MILADINPIIDAAKDDEQEMEIIRGLTTLADELNSIFSTRGLRVMLVHYDTQKFIRFDEMAEGMKAEQEIATEERSEPKEE